MAAERIVQLKESGVECSIDQHTINIRIGPRKEKGARPDYGNFAFKTKKRYNHYNNRLTKSETMN